jgi:uncharacterized protein (DUF1697 family)
MAFVAFLRGVNIGGHKTFRPAALAAELKAFEVVNIGAAGTFVVRRAASAAQLRGQIARRLPFEAGIMICRGKELLDLLASHPFAKEPTGQEFVHCVTILAQRPRTVPKLPLCLPEGEPWQWKLLGVRGVFALSVYRRVPGSNLYTNAVEKTLGVSGTTRNWNTITAIGKILQ